MADSASLNMFKKITNTDIYDGVFDILSETPQAFAGGSPWTFTENVYDSVIMPLALGVIVIYFMIALIQKFTSEQFNWDQMVKTFAIFVGSWYLIQNAFPIMEGMFQIGSNLLQSVSGALSGSVSSPSISASVQEALWQDLTGKSGLEDVGFLDNILLMVQLVPIWLFSLVLGLCAKLICYSRLIEIFIRTMFAPIALSDCFHRGLDGAGARFLKNYFAVAIQGAVIYAIMIIYCVISVSVLASADTSFLGYMGIYLVLSFATIGVLFKSISLTKELVGTA